MATDNNIKNYSAADIEKYHKGLLSAKERHDLEKAALDDSFLADALEGYAVEGVDHSADIIELKKRLAEKVEAGKVIVMKGGGKTSFPWMRVAALVIIIAGAGLMARQFFFTGKTKKDIAEVKPGKTEETKLTDSANTITTTSELKSEKTNISTAVVPLNKNDQFFSFHTKDSTAKGAVSKNSNGETVVTTNEVYANITERDKQPVTAPVKTDEDKKVQDNIASGAYKKDVALDEAKTKPGIINNQDVAKEEAKGKKQEQADMQNNRAVTANQQIANDKVFRKTANDRGYYNPATNTFRGRVTDANNVGLPFARVYNPTDNNAGTYTDVAGNFNITYPDSVVSVQVRSVGFENANVQLRNNVANNQVILQDDRSLATFTLPNADSAKRRLIAKVKLEEPEPADGWDNYDTYIVNNLNPPDEIKTRQNSGGEVEISFEVDKNGNPVNIKVEKSLCSKCDQEAIRLIKQGPKWKRNAKKGRTTVKVPFNNSL